MLQINHKGSLFYSDTFLFDDVLTHKLSTKNWSCFCIDSFSTYEINKTNSHVEILTWEEEFPT